MENHKKSDFSIEVFVKPNSNMESILWDENDNRLEIKIKKKPEKGKANKRLIKLLKDYLKTNEVILIKGQTSSIKVFKILNGIHPKNTKTS